MLDSARLVSKTVLKSFLGDLTAVLMFFFLRKGTLCFLIFSFTFGCRKQALCFHFAKGSLLGRVRWADTASSPKIAFMGFWPGVPKGGMERKWEIFGSLILMALIAYLLWYGCKSSELCMLFFHFILIEELRLNWSVPFPLSK